MGVSRRTPVATQSKCQRRQRRQRRKRSRYLSPEERQWRKVRLACMREAQWACEYPGCEASRATGYVMHCDHILPRSLYPEYLLEPENLQCLCASHNSKKATNTEDLESGQILDYRADRLGYLLAWEDEQEGMYSPP